MCSNSKPIAEACPVSVTLLVEQVKKLPHAQQQEVLQQLHDHIYKPFYAVLLAGPDYR